MGAISEILGLSGDARHYREQAEHVQSAVYKKLYRNSVGIDLFGTDETPGMQESAAQFVMLFGGCLPATDADALIKRLTSPAYWPQYPVPTSPTYSPHYDGGHYWRGNVWLAVNWLIYGGLRRYGADNIAAELATRTAELVEQNGFHEYFHPDTGTGLGPDKQSWTTIVLDMIATEGQADG